MAANLSTMTLPPWASHLEHKLAPPPLLLIQAFVNTLDLDQGSDMLARDGDAQRWLASAGLAHPGPAGTAPGGPQGASLQLAREVRESIRALIGHTAGGEPLTEDQLRPLRQVALDAPPRLEPSATGEVRLVTAGLAGLLAAIRDAQAGGSWSRLKLCGNPDCRWVFYDRSHSRQGAWCDMASCGNRLKNRTLRARRAQAG